jgi:hypothetical protein
MRAIKDIVGTGVLSFEPFCKFYVINSMHSYLSSWLEYVNRSTVCYQWAGISEQLH